MLALLLLLGAASAEFSVRMPYLNPAGVTYTSHVAAYGPLAYKSYAAAPLAATPFASAAHYAAPVAAAPFVAAQYTATPFARYAPVAATPIVAAHSSAVVPVTKISAQPAVVQNLVDVAHPKVATRHYQIRRPAIQKQFYDIEERVIVRPAGSAVVELEQPISANQRGPTEVRPAGPLPVSQPLFRYAGSSNVHVSSPIFSAGYLPHAPAVHEPSVEYEQVHHQEVTPQPFPPQGYPQPLPPQEIPQPFPPQEIPQPTTPQPPQEPFPQQPFPSQPQQPFPQQPFPSQPQPPQQEQSQPEFDSSDSVAIDNPEVARFRGQLNFNFQESVLSSFNRRPQFQSAPQPLPQLTTRTQQPQQLPAEFSQRRNQQEEIFQDGIEPRFGQIPQQLQQQTFERRQFQPQAAPQYQPQFFRRTQLEEVAVPAVQPEISLSRSRRPLPTPRPEVSVRQGATGPTSLPALRTGFEEIPSARNLSPEQTDLNQRRLIELLTARGFVSEVRSADEPLRARVLSATPAPFDSVPTDSRSNTRRVVVNKPIQTVQEVEVAEPFTKVERVAVHQPAVVKTAHVEFAHVPTVTAVPAYQSAVHAYPAFQSAVHAYPAFHSAVHAVPSLHATVTAAPALHAAVPSAVTPVPYGAHYF